MRLVSIMEESVSNSYLEKYHILFDSKCVINGDGLFVCVICEEVRETDDKIINHFLAHTEEKPHVCVHCLMGFDRVEELDSHLVKKHGDNRDGLERSVAANKCSNFSNPSESVFGSQIGNQCSKSTNDSNFKWQPLITCASKELSSATVTKCDDISKQKQETDLVKCSAAISKQSQDKDLKDATPPPPPPPPNVNNSRKLKQAQIILKRCDLLLVKSGHLVGVSGSQQGKEQTVNDTRRSSGNFITSESGEGILGNLHTSNSIYEEQLQKHNVNAALCGVTINDDTESHGSKVLNAGEQRSTTDIEDKPQLGSSEKSFKCDKCSYASSHMFTLRRHITIHAAVRPFKCDLCPYSSSERSGLRVHMHTHTGEKPYACGTCAFRTADFKCLRRHRAQCSISSQKKSHTRVPKVYECDMCPFIGQKTNYVCHLTGHDGVGDFKCTLCSFSASNSKKMKHHLSLHGASYRNNHGEETLNCNLEAVLCDVTVTEEDGSQDAADEQCNSNKDHSFNDKPPSDSKEKPFKCDKCSYASVNISRLRRHITTHFATKPFKCKLCPYSSSERRDLKAHMNRHTGRQQQFKCDRCTYTSFFNSKLSRHMTTHSVDRPYKCELCSYSSSEKGGLRAHMHHHTGEKPFTCGSCSFATTALRYLRSHRHFRISEQNSATTKRGTTFECKLCPFMSDRKAALEKHKSGHARESEYRCSICSYSALNKGALQVHLTWHGNRRTGNEANSERTLLLNRNSSQD